ncbi:MAG: alpha-L-fucosidase [Clostridia bacterium]|nr:alpha-L-fucosidase [Clostridia bacterium]
MFVHFGLYSVLGKGEWAKHLLKIPYEEYDKLIPQFNPDPDWAKQLVATAKKAGAKYITLTTRHHDGFSLYDTCELNNYDTVAGCGRDLVREFVDACNAEGIIPFFYHTLLDWHEPLYTSDFKAYLKYLRRSIEILCTNYGKIGGLWFDGMWDKWDEDWEEDLLYGTIRKYQPDAMIINNTGLDREGALGHIELDSVTFERGKPSLINMESSPKYIASEMCQIFNDHWGYAAEDLNYKSPADMIRDLATCRRYGSNLLMNVGPMGNGLLRPIDAATFGIMGEWVAYFKEAVYLPRPSGIEIENKDTDFILSDGVNYYLFCDRLPMVADPNVSKRTAADYKDVFAFDKEIESVRWLDNDEELVFEQKDGKTTITTTPYIWGRSLVVRVAKITVK